MGKAVQPEGKYKLTLSIDVAFARRFAAYAAFAGEDMSDVAVRALKVEMKGFTIGRRGQSEGEADGPEGGAVRLARTDASPESRAG
jgi:hypothetical protein